MKKKIIFVLLAFFIGVGIFTVIPREKTITVQGSVGVKTFNEIIKDSELIVSGAIVDNLEPMWSNPGYKKGENIANILTTDAVVNINQIYKGNPYNKNEIKVRVHGGNDKNSSTKYVSNGYPKFYKGENVILFLAKDDSDIEYDDNDYYVLVGMLQGKFTEHESKDGNKLYKSAAEWIKEEIDLTTFEDHIKNVLEAQN